MCVPFFVHIYISFDILLKQAAKEVISSCDVLADLLESIEHFVNRLRVYTEIPPTPTIDKVVVDLIVELVSTLGLVTQRLKQRRFRGSVFFNIFTLFTPTQV